MFRRPRSDKGAEDISYTRAAELVSQIGGVYADHNEQGLLVKKRSSLPCPWYVARESFTIAYKIEYLELPENLKNAYHHVYRELSFFIDDDSYQKYEASLDVVAQHQVEQMQKIGMSKSILTCRNLIANMGVTTQTREETWESLIKNNETCQREHLIILAETLGYCSAMYRLMWDEWVAYDTFIAFQIKINSKN